MVFHGHRFPPVLPVAVLNKDRDRRSNGLTVTNTRKKLCGVRFNLHAPTTAVSALPPLQLAVDVGEVHAQSRRQSGKDRHQRLAMGLTCRLESQHGTSERTLRLPPDLRILTKCTPRVKKSGCRGMPSLLSSPMS